MGQIAVYTLCAVTVIVVGVFIIYSFCCYARPSDIKREAQNRLYDERLKKAAADRERAVQAEMDRLRKLHS